MVASDGGVFAYGDASLLRIDGVDLPLHMPIVGMAPSRMASGYWLVASDGGVFAYGDARPLGDSAGLTLNRPLVGMTG